MVEGLEEADHFGERVPVELHPEREKHQEKHQAYHLFEGVFVWICLVLLCTAVVLLGGGK